MEKRKNRNRKNRKTEQSGDEVFGFVTPSDVISVPPSTPTCSDIPKGGKTCESLIRLRLFLYILFKTLKRGQFVVDLAENLTGSIYLLYLVAD